MLMALLLALSLGGDAAAALTPGDHLNQSFVFDGATRLYDVHVPPGYDGSTPVPLVLDFHGYGSNKSGQRIISGFSARANASGFIVVYPQGLFGQIGDPEAVNLPAGPSWNAGSCCGSARATQVDDVGFVRTLVERMAATENIDRTRVYATGLSNGGAMTHQLACVAADLFAAAAPLAYPIPFLPTSLCAPSRPIAVLHFAGLTDALVPYDGGPGISSAVGSFTQWRTNDGCGTGAVEETTVTGSSFCEIDTSCAPGVKTGLCSILSTFPPPFEGHVLYFNNDLVLADVAWDFLSQFALPTAPPALPTRITGRKLVVSDTGEASKRKIAFFSKDPALQSGIDPVGDGASLQLYNTNGTGEAVCLGLPADGWKAVRDGFLYKDSRFTNGPCNSAKVKNGKLLRVRCRANVQPIGFSLDEAAQGSLGVRFRSGATTYCASFGGVVKDVARTFAAKDSTASDVCPAPRTPCP